MENASTPSCSSIEHKSVKKKIMSSKTPAKRAECKDSGIVQSSELELALTDPETFMDEPSYGYESNQPSTSSATSVYASLSTFGDDQSFQQALDKSIVNKFLKGKVGADINAKKWLEGCSGLNDFNKSEVIIRLVYEVCLAKNIEYDLENDAAENEKEKNKDKNFDTRRIMEILKMVNRLLLPEDRKRLVEFVCQNGNVKLLEMICAQEEKDGGSKARTDQQYSWRGEFTGYKTIIELLQYTLKQPCSPEIVLCMAKKVYGGAHIIYNGVQYLDCIQIANMKGGFGYQDTVMKECLKEAIELGYKDVVSVMLSGDIYQCIRLMKGKKFEEEKIFLEALDMIGEAVADIINSWLKDKKQSCKDEIQSLLKNGIEIDIEKMGKKDLIDELEYRGREVKCQKNTTKKEVMDMLKDIEELRLRLGKTVVGALISTLFFKYQDKLVGKLKGKKSFELGLSLQDQSRREKEINELNEKIDSKKFVHEKVLKSIQLLNSSSHTFNNWFFRELLEKVVNDKLDKLQGVCAAICKKPMEELLQGMEVYEEVMNVLKHFHVEHNEVITHKKYVYSDCNAPRKFEGDVENLVEGIRKLNDLCLMADEVLSIAIGLASNKVPAFSGLSRRTIINLKIKRDKEGLTGDEAKDLREKVSKIMEEIIKGIDTLAADANRIDIEDIFRHFKIINSEIPNEDKRKIVMFICQKSNVQLLEMI